VIGAANKSVVYQGESQKREAHSAGEQHADTELTVGDAPVGVPDTHEEHVALVLRSA
jgi:hypothetical protein